MESTEAIKRVFARHFPRSIMKELERILTDYQKTFAVLQQEERQRSQLIASDEYQELQEQIAALQEAQKSILSRVPDSSEEHEADKKELLDYLNTNRITELPGFELKTRTTKNVNTTTVLNALGGDLDQFFTIANVTQKALGDYAKLHPDLKKPFKSAIEIESVGVTDVIPFQPSAA